MDPPIPEALARGFATGARAARARPVSGCAPALHTSAALRLSLHRSGRTRSHRRVVASRVERHLRARGVAPLTIGNDGLAFDEQPVLAQIELRIEDPREDPGVLEEVVPSRRLSGRVGQGAFCGEPRDEVFGIDNGGCGEARPCSHMELYSAPSSFEWHPAFLGSDWKIHPP